MTSDTTTDAERRQLIDATVAVILPLGLTLGSAAGALAYALLDWHAAACVVGGGAILTGWRMYRHHRLFG